MARRYASTHEMVPPLPMLLVNNRPRAGTAAPASAPDSELRIHVLEAAVHKELASLNGQEELFLRSTSDLSTLLRDISHDHGRSYFRYVLRDVFGGKSSIYQSSTSSHSHTEIVVYANSIVKRLARAIHYAPLVLRASTQYVLRQFQNKFPQCKCSERIVVGSVLFLRILCPALIKPEIFGFESHTPQSRATCVQIAKLLQHTLRGSLCNSNQPESVASNQFVAAVHPFVETFLARFPQLATNMRELQRSPYPLTRFASWDELDTSRSAPDTPTSCRGHVEEMNRLRGMSMSTPEDMTQRKKKFSLKFW